MTAALCFLVLSLPSAKADVTSEMRANVIRGLSQSLRETYVEIELGKKAAALLESNLANRVYDDLKEGPAFAKKLTADVNSLCHDAHFHVSYSAEGFPKRENNLVPSREEQEQARRQVRIANAGFEQVERLPGNIGLIKINGFFDPSDVARPAKAAFDFVANTDALIFDMRDNGGGSPGGVQLVCSYLFPPTPRTLNTIHWRTGNSFRIDEFKTLPRIDGTRYANKPVFVLTGPRCGSAGEEFCYNLQTQKRATLVGDRTWGGANPGRIVRLSDNFVAFVPYGKAVNPITKKNWEGTGVKPDVACDPKDALKRAHILAVQKLLSNPATPEDKSRLSEVLKEIGG